MDWNEFVADWSKPPVDDFGYISSAEMINWTDDKLREVITTMRHQRYEGWRNHNGLWRDVLALDRGDLRVLDYGCGVGMEAAELARAGNIVDLADISSANIEITRRVMKLTAGRDPVNTFHVGQSWPFLNCPSGTYDVIHCSGVLHHIRKARLTIERFHELLCPGGEVRLMLYSDVGWRLFAKTEPPPEPVDHDPGFTRFVRAFDQVGDYATWYDEAKLTQMFGDLFTVDRFDYLTPNRQYCGAVLIKKEGS